MGKNINIYKILCIALAIVLVIVVGIMIYRNYTQNRAGDIYNNLQTQVNESQDETEFAPIEEETQIVEEEIPEEAVIEIPEKSLDWGMLAAINTNIYAWIYIPETNVDYPVLQHPDDDDYYLDHNMDGSYGYPGCIYTQMLNKEDFSDFNTVMYGHNMKDGTMFRTLHYYENEEFFNNNPYVFVYTKEDVFVYEVFAAYNSGEDHILNVNDFSTEEGIAAYLEKVKLEATTNGYYKEEIELDESSHILSLSTCSDLSTERYLVQAALVSGGLEEEEIMEVLDTTLEESTSLE